MVQQSYVKMKTFAWRVYLLRAWGLFVMWECVGACVIVFTYSLEHRQLMVYWNSAAYVDWQAKPPLWLMELILSFVWRRSLGRIEVEHQKTE